MLGKRKQPSLEDLSEDLQGLFEVLNGESNIAIGLVSAAYLEAALRSTLSRHFIQGKTSDALLSPGGALSTFAAKAQTAYALGLISEPLYKTLIQIGEIRNIMAHHHLQLGFGDVNVQAACEKLNYLEMLDQEQKLKGSSQGNLFSRYASDARTRFTLTVVHAATHIVLQGLSVSRCEKNVAYVQNFSVRQQP
jgi:DNA-binding MltR family transcriptional regulator